MPGKRAICVFDKWSGSAFEVNVVLMGVFADGPARDKMTLALGHNALLGCYWCAMPGQKKRTTVDKDGVVFTESWSAV